MKTGLYISGLAHAALILWLLFGGWIMPGPEEDLLQVSEVSIISSEEFAALSAPEAAPEPVSAAPLTSPAPPARPEAPAPEPEPVPAPEAEPRPAPEPEAEPRPAPAPPAPESAPADIDRVAPEAAPEPSPEAETAPEVRDEVAASETGDQPQPETPATAPEAATTEIVTEATETADLAPVTSMRPPARPNRPAPAAQPDAAPEAETAPAPDPVADAVADAVAEAVAASPAAPTPSPAAPAGPPLSRGEMNALRVSVGNCWNVGSLSSEALQTTVVLAVAMLPDGKPEIGSIRLVSFTGGTEAAARRAYETARRAIIRCGATGYNLPSDKYEQWKEIEMTFNPENMRIK